MTDIMSSPVRNVIDPLICSYSDQNDKKAKNASTPNNNGPKIKSLVNKNISKEPNESNSNGVTTGSASSILGLSGWTPFLSRTSQPEGILSHVSTPSSKMFSTLYKQNHTILPLDFDCGSLNLTPFLAHNINLGPQGSGTNSAMQNVSFTPLCDKSLHLADYFMDSPIRQTPRKVGSFTPSRFTLAPEQRSAVRGETQLLSELSLKRSIALIDTPARQPFKKAEQNNGIEEENDRNSKGLSRTAELRCELQRSSDLDKYGRPPQSRAALAEVSSNKLNKTPFRRDSAVRGKLETPAHPMSSPSTVIMSSVTKSPEKGELSPPASPTPQKEVKVDTAEPVMGIFFERKPKTVSCDTKSVSGKKSQKKQANGMSRFQIVFTDVHTLMNGKKKKGAPALSIKSDIKSNRKQRSRSKEDSPTQKNVAGNESPKMVQDNTFSYSNAVHGAQNYPNSVSQNFNTSINTSREFSMMSNSALNTTTSNFTVSDQSPFDLIHGGIISTPNGNYLQDLLFEKLSPSTGQNMAAKFSSFDEHDQSLDVYHRQKFMPPLKTMTLQQAAQNALKSRNQYVDTSNIGASHYAPCQIRQMAMIHPDLQGLHHDVDGPLPKQHVEKFQMSTPQQLNRNVPMLAIGPYDNRSSPSGKELKAYFCEQMEQYLHRNVSNAHPAGAYSTSPTQTQPKQQRNRSKRK